MSPGIFISRDGEQFGPYTEEQAGGLLEAGNLVADDLAWHEGLPEWVPLHQILPVRPDPGPARLAAPTLALPAMPTVFRPPGAAVVPQGSHADEVADTPRPWRRYFARHLDILVFAFGLGMLLFMCGAGNQLEEMNDYLLGAIIMLGWPVIEAPMLAITGTTPGKFLFGLWVEREDGRRPQFGQALARAYAVVVNGLGVGIPIFALITCVRSYQRLEAEGRTSWDEVRNLRVVSPPRAWWMWILVWFSVLAAGVLLFFAAALAMGLREGWQEG